MICPKCKGKEFSYYLLTATFHSPETKVARCNDCGYEITVSEVNQIRKDESLEIKRKEMRKVGAFTKYCAKCGKTFGSDDMDEFLKMVEDHEC